MSVNSAELHPLTELNRRTEPIERAWAFGYHHRRCLHVGADDSGWILARPERSLLVIGPPRDTGKTTAVLVPTVLCAYAPVVAASTKDDVFAATAQTRALMGRLWHFAPDGSEPTPAGARKLRWSPVPAARDWDMAVTTAEVMISVANATLGGHSSGDGGFWSIQAGGLLAPLFHAAALADLDMRTVMRWVMLRDLSEAAQILESASDYSPGTRTAWELLGGAARAPPATSSPATGDPRTRRSLRIGANRRSRSRTGPTSTRLGSSPDGPGKLERRPGSTPSTSTRPASTKSAWRR